MFRICLTKAGNISSAARLSVVAIEGVATDGAQRGRATQEYRMTTVYNMGNERARRKTQPSLILVIGAHRVDCWGM